jgi:hypothetical protein
MRRQWRNIMDKSQMRVRPGFLLGLFAFLASFGWFISTGVPTEKDKTKAKMILTRVEERIMAESLQENASKTGELTNISPRFIFESFVTTNKSEFPLPPFATRTNSTGQFVDIWQTPYRFELVKPANFIIHSAGPNRQIGDADDVVFNSASNGFVRP